MCVFLSDLAVLLRKNEQCHFFGLAVLTNLFPVRRDIFLSLTKGFLTLDLFRNCVVLRELAVLFFF